MAKWFCVSLLEAWHPGNLAGGFTGAHVSSITWQLFQEGGSRSERGVGGLRGPREVTQPCQPLRPEEGGEVRQPAKEGGWGPFPHPLESGLGCPAASGPEVEGRQEHTMRKLTKMVRINFFRALEMSQSSCKNPDSADSTRTAESRSAQELVAFSLGLLKTLHSLVLW